MKIKSFVTFALLFVLGFSVMHEYAFAFLDDEHSTAIEYVAKLEHPTEHGDICDSHFQYHEAFVLSGNIILPKLEHRFLSRMLTTESYNFKTYENFFKPPIS